MAISAPSSGPVLPRTAPVSVSDMVGYGCGADNGTFDEILAAATQHVEDRCGPIGDTAWQYLVRQDHRSTDLRLPAPGIATVTTVLDPASVDVTSQIEAADVDWMRAVIVAPYWLTGSWKVTVTTHRQSGDDELSEAVLIIAKHLLGLRSGQSVRPSGFGGPQGGPVATYSIPNRAKDLMAGHLLTTGMAR